MLTKKDPPALFTKMLCPPKWQKAFLQTITKHSHFIVLYSNSRKSILLSSTYITVPLYFPLLKSSPANLSDFPFNYLCSVGSLLRTLHAKYHYEEALEIPSRGMHQACSGPLLGNFFDFHKVIRAPNARKACSACSEYRAKNIAATLRDALVSLLPLQLN